MQQRGLSRVGWPDEGDLGRTLAAHCDRVAIDDSGARSGGFNFAKHPLADVGVRAILVVWEPRQNAPQFAHTLGALLADEAPFDKRHLRAMGHGHDELVLRLLWP